MAAKTYSILIVPDDHSGTRQFRLSRRLLVIGLAAVAGLVLLILIFLVTYGSVLGRARHVPQLRRENQELRDQIVVLNDLNRELEDLSVLRAQVLALLGQSGESDALSAGPERSPESTDPLLSLQPERIDHLAAVDLVRRYTPSHWPLDGEVRREFHLQASANQTTHPGLDILPQNASEPVASAGAGRVAQIGMGQDDAAFLRVEHGFAVESYYFGLSQLLVDVGQMVEAGQALGYVGTPLNGESPPLYFEIRLDGTPVDPRRYLEAR